jgi:hypothetical protein
VSLTPREEAAAVRAFNEYKRTGQKPIGLTAPVAQRALELAAADVLGITLEEFQHRAQRFSEHQAALGWISVLTGLSHPDVVARLKEVVAASEERA